MADRKPTPVDSDAAAGPAVAGEPRGSMADGAGPPDDPVGAVLSSPEAGGAAMRGGALRVAGYGVNSLLGALAAAVLFRHLGVADTGLYVTALSIAAIVGGLSDLGLTAQGVRELSVRDAPGRAALMRNLLGLRIALTAVGVAGSVIFAVVVDYPAVVVAGVAVAGAGLLLQNVQSTLALSLMSRLRLGLVTATDTARQVVLTVLTLILVAVGAGLLSFVAAIIPAAAVSLVVTVRLVRQDVPLRPRFDAGEWRALVRDVLPYAAAVALAIVYFRLSVIVVSLTASSQELGYFATSFRILEALIVIPGLMVTAVFPIFARSALDDHARLAYAVSRVFAVMLIAGAWFALVVALGAPIAIDIVGGARFADAVGVLRIQAIGLGGSFLGALWGTVLLSLGRQRQLMLINLAALVAGIVLVSVLASAHGAQGAALGTAITELALAVGTPLALARTDPQILPPLAVVPRVALATGLAALLVLVPGLPVVVLVALATGVYFSLLLVMRAVPEEVLVDLRRIVRALPPRTRPA